MEKTRLQQIEQVFQTAVERSQDERRAFLDETCGSDDELRLEVESLLRYADESPNFIDSPPALLAAEIFDDADDIPTLISEEISHYKVEEFLGHGGMGEVYLAEDTRLQRRVALKVLTQNLVYDTDRLLRFEREARSASALNHPNILTVHEFGEAEGIHFIASEFVDGVTLRERLMSGRQDLGDTLDIAIQIASALSAAHEAGITHRDIKPENVMVRRDGYVKVLDFGLAKLRQEEPLQSAGTEDPTRALLRTEPGVVLGTDAYMSPEQARGIQIDARSDIWSLGVVIYEMLAGQRPFLGSTRADVIVSVLASEPLPISSLRPDVPSEVEWVVSKALSKDTDARYQSAKELRADLIKIKKQLELHESLSRSGDNTVPPSGPGRGERIHSTVETGLKTSQEPAQGTDGGADVPLSTPRAFYSIKTVADQARTHKLGSLSVLAVLVLIVSFGAYLALVGTSGQIDSIAVLPFENTSGSAELNYVSDGLSESLIDRFAQLPQLKVISRNSSFKFRGPNLDLGEVAAQLGVRAVVTGSVTKLGDELSVRVDITDARDNRQLTGGRYRRKSSDLARLEQEIAHAAAEQLQVQLTDAQTTRMAASATDNSEAFRYYLSGLVELNGPQGVLGKALEYFEQAVKLDPEFAAAYAEIAWIYWARANGSGNPEELVPRARVAAERALEIDADLPKAHVLGAMLKEYEFDWPAAEAEYKRAIELSPNLDFARNNYAFFLSVMGRQKEALAEIEEQRVRDPINMRLNLLHKAIVLTQARRFDEALQTYQEAQALEPSREIPNFSLAYAYAGKGLYNEAAEYYRRSVAAVGGEDKYSQPLVYLAATYAKIPEKQAEARAIVARIEALDEYVSPALLAIPYAELGQNGRAIELLEQAYIRRDLLLRFIGTGYEYDALRDDPRFVDLVTRVGLSPSVRADR